ncbi:MAG: flagellar hook-length control protein FliK [Pseudomonadota bacterium]
MTREDGQVSVQLDPPELGRLSVTLDPSDPSGKAIVSADRALTADLARRHADLLLTALRDAGIDAAGVDIADPDTAPGGGLPDSGPERDVPRSGRAENNAADRPATPEVETTGFRQNGSLDRRV